MCCIKINFFIYRSDQDHQGERVVGVGTREAKFNKRSEEWKKSDPV
jgi:hypothetical protein